MESSPPSTPASHDPSRSALDLRLSADSPIHMSNPLTHAASLDPEHVVEADTDVGKIWVEKGAHVLTDSLLEHGYWDPTISGLIRKTLAPGMTFVDAGANIGYFSLLASQIVGPDGRVFAVEPDPVNEAVLRANLWRNGCDNVTVLPLAAWAERTHLNMDRPAEEGAVTQVGMENGGGGRMVPAAPLDDLITGPIDYMKIDCEYTDHVVVNSAKRLIDENPSMLISVEFHPLEDSHTGDSPGEILSQYRDLGLTPYELAPDGSVVEKSSYKRIASHELPEGHNCFDFVLTRNLPAHIPTGSAAPPKDSGAPRKGFLEKAGDLLERVPEPIRPAIRDRDRAARSGKPD